MEWIYYQQHTGFWKPLWFIHDGFAFQYVAKKLTRTQLAGMLRAYRKEGYKILKTNDDCFI